MKIFSPFLLLCVFSQIRFATGDPGRPDGIKESNSIDSMEDVAQIDSLGSEIATSTNISEVDYVFDVNVTKRPSDMTIDIHGGDRRLRHLDLANGSLRKPVIVGGNASVPATERELHELSDNEIKLIGLVTGEVCSKACEIVAKCPPGPIGQPCQFACGLSCGLIADLTEAILEFFQGCCRSDNAWLTVQASSKVQHAGGNSLEVTWYSTGGRTDRDSLGSIDRGETKTWYEDLSSRDLVAVELRVDETNDICASNFVVKVGPEPSGTNREEVIPLSAAVISYITKRPLIEDCLYFGDEEGAIGNFMFHWPSALRCFKNFQFYSSLEYANCLTFAMYRFDVRRNGRYTRTTYRNPGNLPSHFRNPFGRIRTRLSSGMCMDLARSSTRNGNAIQLYPCNGRSNQEWDFDSEGRIRSKVNPAKCVEAGRRGGLYTKLFIWDCNEATHQRWTRYTDGRIRNKGHKFYLGIAYCRGERSRPLELRNREGGTCGTSQQWYW